MAVPEKFVFKKDCTKDIKDKTTLTDVKYIITKIQRRLDIKKPNGTFGPQTEQAVKDFQTKQGLSVTGEITNGDKTYKKIFGTEVYKKDDEDKIIENIQRILGITVNGKFDANTKTAVEEFQGDAGLDKGSVGFGTINALSGWRVTYKKGMSSSQIKRIRKILKLSESTKFDTDLENAVKKFQKEKGLGDDGVAGPKTLRKIFAKGELYKNGDGYKTGVEVSNKGEGIRRIQYKLGLTVDGDFGPGTESKVREFQQQKGLSVDGKVGPETYDALISSTEVVTVLPKKLKEEMDKINVKLDNYSGYKEIAGALAKHLPQHVVAGLIGTIIPESGTQHRILNKAEYKGKGRSGTDGWNCGEGLVQWTFWKNKLPLIKKYNSDSRATKKLPTSWDVYQKGEPLSVNNNLYAKEDSTHISGLSLEDQMVFLIIYYNSLIKEVEDETNLAIIVAKFFQQKAGNAHYFDYRFDPIMQTYYTGKVHYPQSGVNSYLKSLKLADEYYKNQVPPSTGDPVEGDTKKTKEEKKLEKKLEKAEKKEQRKQEREERRKRKKAYKISDITHMNEGRKTKATQGTVLGAHMRQK